MEGNRSPAYEGMHPLDNSITWSSDGKKILFVAQSSGRDVLYLVDVPAGKVAERIVLPLRSIKDPSVSATGGRSYLPGFQGDTATYISTTERTFR